MFKSPASENQEINLEINQIENRENNQEEIKWENLTYKILGNSPLVEIIPVQGTTYNIKKLINFLEEQVHVKYILNNKIKVAYNEQLSICYLKTDILNILPADEWRKELNYLSNYRIKSPPKVVAQPRKKMTKSSLTSEHNKKHFSILNNTIESALSQQQDTLPVLSGYNNITLQPLTLENNPTSPSIYQNPHKAIHYKIPTYDFPWNKIFEASNLEWRQEKQQILHININVNVRIGNLVKAINDNEALKALNIKAHAEPKAKILKLVFKNAKSREEAAATLQQLSDELIHPEQSSKRKKYEHNGLLDQQSKDVIVPIETSVQNETDLYGDIQVSQEGNNLIIAYSKNTEDLTRKLLPWLHYFIQNIDSIAPEFTGLVFNTPVQNEVGIRLQRMMGRELCANDAITLKDVLLYLLNPTIQTIIFQRPAANDAIESPSHYTGYSCTFHQPPASQILNATTSIDTPEQFRQDTELLELAMQQDVEFSLTQEASSESIVLQYRK